MDKPRDPADLKKRKIRRILLAVAGAVAIAVVSVAVANLEPAALAVEKESVWSETVQRGTFVREVRGPGTLVPETIRFISAASAGRVDEVLVEAGSRVEADTVLVELTNPEVEQAALDAELGLVNSTIVDLRLNENKIRSVHYSSLSRFGNLTYLNLTKNDISYVEDGAFSAQFNLQVSDVINIYIHPPATSLGTPVQFNAIQLL